MHVCIFSLFFFLCALSFASEELNVYTYSSLTGKGSLSEALKTEWEAKGHKVKFTSFSTSSEMLNQVFLEKEKTLADVVLGIDQLGIKKAESSGYFVKEDFSSYAKEMSLEVPKTLMQSGFVPFDYGYLAFVYDSSKVKGVPPTSFAEFLAQNQKSKRLILIDPRTSQLGLSFLAWTKMLWKGAEWEKNMKTLSQSTKIWAPGWSAAYSLFMKNEGDYVLSYTTSPAYHVEEEKKAQYKALHFKEGHLLQIETAAVTKTSKNQLLAKDFLKILVSKSVQERIPKLQWMYPVVKNVAVPESFKNLPQVKPLPESVAVEESSLKTWLSSWIELILTRK